jgi:hypothetical protein
LERGWARWFGATGWRALYVGDRAKFADFLLVPVGLASIFVECKPDNREFLLAAARRLRQGGVGEALITLGPPAFARWYLLWPGANRLRPCPSPGPSDRGTTGMSSYLAAVRGTSP